ncbi:ATPase, Ca transporting, plasma membrane [Cichlidogyrus casuarinus]|uniref:Calcium-transporting ATPase n=1 Tax=Cichlidogyrus casuarinus TaxID=1844966 RepID=A0ABD2PZU7_9PLAT
MASRNLSIKDLQKLMELRGGDAIKVLESDFNGTDGLCNSLHVDPNEGLSSEDVKTSRTNYGQNFIPPKPPKSFLQLAWEACQDITLIVLMVASVVSLLLAFYNMIGESGLDLERSKHENNYEWVDGLAILLAILIVVNVVAFNDWQKERQFRGLQSRIEADNKFSVLRKSQGILQITVKDIVVGDICMVKYGDLIPADGVLIQSNDLKLDESALTGESDLVKKGIERDPMLLSGTHVMAGSGKMVVTAVGVNSQAGIIFTLMSHENDQDIVPESPTKTEPKNPAGNGELVPHDLDSKTKNSELPLPALPPIAEEDDEDEGEDKQEAEKRKFQLKHMSVLQQKLTRLAIQIGYFGAVMATLTMVVVIIRYCVEEFYHKKSPWDTSRHLRKFTEHFIMGVTVLVVAVPEGLPLAVTISLAYSVKKMMKDNNLVRHLDACETMGNATSICSDKTGTLTTNRMTVVQCYLGQDLCAPNNLPSANQIQPQILEQLKPGIAVNSGYTSLLIGGDQPGELPSQVGNKTECALLGLLVHLGVDYSAVRAKNPESSFVKVFTFSSQRKSMSTVVRDEANSKSLIIYTKGASEIVLSMCTQILDSAGQPSPLSDDRVSRIKSQVIDHMASNGLRTIGIAYRRLDNMSNDELTEEKVLKDLILIGIVGIEDPVRPEVPHAIFKCQHAGITVRMVTGDNLNTARSIASKCGILKHDQQHHPYSVLEGKRFNELVRDKRTGKVSQALVDKVWPHLRVLARSSPQDKYTLVKGIIESHLTASREVVAVTGDGTNDGPALKRADVGFAMGIAGTDVAKEASDIILTDDNFSSIVKAVMWGRNVYDSISKFLQFQLTVNVVAVIVAFIGSCLITVSLSPPTL